MNQDLILYNRKEIFKELLPEPYLSTYLSIAFNDKNLLPPNPTKKKAHIFKQENVEKLAIILAAQLSALYEDGIWFGENLLKKGGKLNGEEL